MKTKHIHPALLFAAILTVIFCVAYAANPRNPMWGEKAEPNTLTIAAEALKNLTEEPKPIPDFFKPEVPQDAWVFLTNIDPTLSRSTDITISIFNEKAKNPLDVYFECSHDGKTFRTKWEERKP